MLATRDANEIQQFPSRQRKIRVARGTRRKTNDRRSCQATTGKHMIIGGVAMIVARAVVIWSGVLQAH
jgi:hypothetical protein